MLTLCRKGAGALRLIVGTAAGVLGFEREKKRSGGLARPINQRTSLIAHVTTGLRRRTPPMPKPVGSAPSFITVGCLSVLCVFNPNSFPFLILPWSVGPYFLAVLTGVSGFCWLHDVGTRLLQTWCGYRLFGALQNVEVQCMSSPCRAIALRH